jgi:hypothetical protein
MPTDDSTPMPRPINKSTSLHFDQVTSQSRDGSDFFIANGAWYRLEFFCLLFNSCHWHAPHSLTPTHSSVLSFAFVSQHFYLSLNHYMRSFLSMYMYTHTYIHIHVQWHITMYVCTCPYTYHVYAHVSRYVPVMFICMSSEILFIHFIRYVFVYAFTTSSFLSFQMCFHFLSVCMHRDSVYCLGNSFRLT